MRPLGSPDSTYDFIMARLKSSSPLWYSSWKNFMTPWEGGSKGVRAELTG